MKELIKEKFRAFLIENNTKTICNTMSVATYEQGMQLLIHGIGKPDENPEMWAKIQKPLKMWKDSVTEIRHELSSGMTGDSEVDESNTWWAAIQSSICK
jgi:hypothetical protein